MIFNFSNQVHDIEEIALIKQSIICYHSFDLLLFFSESRLVDGENSVNTLVQSNIRGIIGATTGQAAQLQQHLQQQQNSITINNATVAQHQTMKPLQQRIQIQQLSNQPATIGQQQSFITTMQHNNAVAAVVNNTATGFSQQILPKLPTLPQNVVNFNSTQGGLQLVTQTSSVPQLQHQQSQHGGTLS